MGFSLSLLIWVLWMVGFERTEYVVQQCHTTKVVTKVQMMIIVWIGKSKYTIATWPLHVPAIAIGNQI